jgi:tetratricopeptide (TPR) repeat protein
MKKVLLALFVMSTISITAQTKSELLNHFEAYYKQMKSQGDVQGIINAITHLEVISPSQERRDTLAYIYVSEGRHLEALNTIGVEKNATDSNINTEVKAIALKALNQPKLAVEQYEVLFTREPNPYIAYEIADLKTQVGDFFGAKASIAFGIANAKDDMKRPFYESQQPYEVTLKAAFLYLKGLVLFNENQTTNLDAAIALMDEALVIAPNFNLAKISKEALVAKKPKE